MGKNYTISVVFFDTLIIAILMPIRMNLAIIGIFYFNKCPISQLRDQRVFNSEMI